MIKSIINGFCMSLADSVPGVSGGTIAFIMGFYDDFIQSIHDVFYGKSKEKRIAAIIYLLKLGIGFAAGMILSVLILTSAFESNIYVVSSLFMGFIVASIPMVLYEERKTITYNVKFNISTILCFGIGIFVVVLLTILNQSTFSSGVNMAHLTVSGGIYVFVGGAISISAMFLPGISGSSILLVLGLYLPVMKAGKEIITLHFEYLPSMIIFAAGMAVGALSVVKIIQWSLEKYRPQMVLLIVGLMCGSLYSVVMGATTLENPRAPLSLETFNWLAFFIGVGLIALLEFLGSKRKKREELG